MMNYATGESVKLGDRVGLGNDSGGVVVCLFDTREFSAAHAQAEWGYLKKGALIHFPIHGLIHCEAAMEPDVKLIARGPIPV